MAKKVQAKVKLQIPAGKANPAPPVGPALGQHGVNIMGFVREFNDRTKKLDEGTVYTVFAMGLAGGSPALMAVPSVDSSHTVMAADAAPTALPKTGASDSLPLLAIVLGGLMVVAGLARRRFAVTRVRA